ncbi:MAG TPA: hypothetical protein VF650_06255 [Allosphingosinicella sp.]
MKWQHVGLGAGALGAALVAPAQVAHAQAKPGSAYVQCDGQPDNVSSGETAARLLGAVTLLGLFAPSPEAPDASKRKFGAEGVAACTSLLSGDKLESSAKRRLGLILGRAIHQIEAKNYEAAIADVALARREAEAAGLTADPYFVRSRGRAFDLVESAALARLGRAEEARQVSLRGAGALQYALFGLFSTPTYGTLTATPSEAEERLLEWRSRLAPAMAIPRADRLDLAGRFAESARIRDALAEYDSEHSPETNGSLILAQAAVAHALAGNAAVAAERAKAARANSEQRKAAGKPESDAVQFIEALDLYSIVETANSGDLKAARRLFAARSQWASASLGSVMEVNRRLRQGAAAEELIGGLARDSAQLWKEHVDTNRAALASKDGDNRTLFALVPGLRSASAYEAMSKNVWRTDKSKLILKLKTDASKSKMELMYLPFTDPLVAMEAYVLHAALIARSRGHQGFVFTPILSDKIAGGAFRSGNRGDKGFPADLFIPAEDVIAKLGPVLPSPAAIAARPKAQ